MNKTGRHEGVRDLKTEELESEVLCTNSTALIITVNRGEMKNHSGGGK
jgi:hypothetical protein